MMDNLRLHPEYKDSEFSWFGEFFSHWELKRIGHLLSGRGEVNTKGEVTNVLSVLKNRGVIPYEEEGNIGNKKII